MTMSDVLIIGNGILGISTAYRLVAEDPTLKVTVVGPYRRTDTASAAAGAMLNCFGEISRFTFQSEYTHTKFKIAREAAKYWPSWLHEINDELLPSEHVKVTPGTFILLNNKAGARENKNFLAIQQATQQYQEPCEEVDPLEIPGMRPLDDARPLRALYLPNEGSLNPIQLLAALEKVTVKKGQVKLLDTLIDRMVIEKGKIIGAQTATGEILQGKVVLLAAGAYCQTLLAQIPSLSNRIPKLLAGSGCSIVFKVDNHQFKNVVRTPNRSGSCGSHILPYNNNSQLLYMGSSNNVRLDPKIEPMGRNIFYLLKHAIEQFNQDLHKAALTEWRLGNRPVSFDTFPLVGQTSINGLWLMTGTYRDGIHSSPIWATSIAQEILGKPSLLEHPFQPERFPIEIMSKSESIAEFADQYISAGYEHGIDLPKQSWDLALYDMFYKRTESLYEALEIDIGLSSDILIMFAQEPAMIPIFREYYKKAKQEFNLHNLPKNLKEEVISEDLTWYEKQPYVSNNHMTTESH